MLDGQQNKPLIVILWGIMVLASIIGLSIPGLFGAVISFILAIFASMLGPYAIQTIIRMCELE